MNIKRFLSYALVAVFIAVGGTSQTAASATNAQSIQFLLSQVRNASGPLSGGKVYFYAAGATTTPKTVWSTRGKTVEAANPYTLDSLGTAQLYGDGLYRIVITTSTGIIVYDRDYISIKDVSTLAYDVADYASLAAAVSAIGSTPATLQYSTDQTLTSNLTIPANIELVPVNGAVISKGAYTLTIISGATKFVRPEYFGHITYGTSASGSEQSANVAAFNAALSVSAASNIPCKVGAGTILVNDNIVSAAAVSVVGDAATPTRMMQTAVGKYVFYLGSPTYPDFTYGYRLANLHLASAAGAAGNVYLGNIIASHFENVTMPAAGVYGWTIKDCQELYFKACNQDGRYNHITGMNKTGSSQGVWGNGSTTGAAWLMTGNTTVVAMEECDCNITTRGMISDAASLVLKWSGLVQGMNGLAADITAGADGSLDLDLYTESETSGGIVITGSNRAKIHGRMTDVNGVDLRNCSNVTLSGKINRVKVDANCRRVRGNNVMYAQVTGGGYIQDLSPDGSWTDCVNSAQDGVAFGKTSLAGMLAININNSLERWDGASVPCGFVNYGSATVTKTGTGLADTTKFSGSFAAKVVGHASNAWSGLRGYLNPAVNFTGKTVTISGRYKSAESWYAVYFKGGGTVVYESIPASGADWACFSVTFKIDSNDTGPKIHLSPLASKTVYFDEIDISVNGYDVALPQILPTAAAPDINYGVVPIRFWKFANAAPTNVTGFTGGYGGLDYTFILDANTTLVNSATMKLRGGANKTGANVVIRLIYDSENAVWYQTGYESAN